MEEAIPMEQLLAREKRRATEAALEETGEGSLKPIKERLGDNYSYREIRFARITKVRGL